MPYRSDEHWHCGSPDDPEGGGVTATRVLPSHEMRQHTSEIEVHIRFWRESHNELSRAFHNRFTMQTISWILPR